MKSIAIIGAGLAGLTAAQYLQNSYQITVYDKSRGVSGRMSTRKAVPYGFDHGAQYFTVRDPQFKHFIESAMAKNLVSQWKPDIWHIGKDGYSVVNQEEDWYVAQPTMTALCKSMAMETDIVLNTKVSRIEYNDEQWLMYDQNNRLVGKSDYIICALPQPQIMDLLQHQITITPDLERVDMHACFTLMIGMQKSSAPNFDYASVVDSPIRVISNMSSKPGRAKAQALVVQTDNRWSEQNIDMPIRDIETLLLIELNSLLGHDYSMAHFITTHRWRYAYVAQPYGKDFFKDPNLPLYACGDWCIGPRVEAAFISGYQLAQSLISIDDIT